MARAIGMALFLALEANNVEEFHSILKRDGLPGGGWDVYLLKSAIERQNKPIAKLLLDNGCSVELLELPMPEILLIMAETTPGWYDVVQKILERGVCVTNPDEENGNTALHLAFYSAATECTMHLLLNHFLEQTTVDLKNKDGLGCIHIAATTASIESVKRCLTFADVNAQVSSTAKEFFSGYSPLHFAVAYNKPDVADLLCQHNADLYIQDRQGSTPIHLALERGNVKMLDILFRYDKKHTDCANSCNLTHFMAACAASDPLVVQQYLRAADEKSTNSSGFMMTSQALDIGKRPFSGYTPLKFAVEFGRLPTFRLLLKRGAFCQQRNLFPVNVASSQWFFPLMRQHFAECPRCKEKYKRLVYSNTGINHLTCINRETCPKPKCNKFWMILLGIFMVIGFVVGIWAYVQVNTEIEEEHFSYDS